jgi:hypothetical protein
LTTERRRGDVAKCERSGIEHAKTSVRRNLMMNAGRGTPSPKSGRAAERQSGRAAERQPRPRRFLAAVALLGAAVCQHEGDDHRFVPITPEDVELLALALNTTRPRPTLECVSDDSGALTAHYGYYNPASSTVDVPIGGSNKFTPNPIDRGQPTSFRPGRYRFDPRRPRASDDDVPAPPRSSLPVKVTEVAPQAIRTDFEDA